MLSAGAVVGRDFRVERELARGGMGGVWLAEQLSTGQKRALKVMHPTLVAEPRMRERFEQEARIGGRVPSEHVVEVIAAGVDAELGIPWLAMELLHGEDLAAFSARRGPLPLSELLPIFRQLCHALGAAHSVGIVHRDVKPENVFLAEVHSADASRQVKVLDFGIAKLAAEAKESGTGQIGTPLWMAPEQSDPRAPITPAADVWALGLLAFRLLTGRHYWRTANDPSAALSALFKETLMEPLVPASERAREYGAGGALLPGFDGWFSRAVQRDPSQRFLDAHAAFGALEALALASVPAVASGASERASSAPFPRRSSAAPLALGLILLVALGALVVVAAGAGLYVYLAREAPVPGASPSAPALGATAVEPPAPLAPSPSASGKLAATGARGRPAVATTAAPTAPAAGPPAEPVPTAPSASAAAPSASAGGLQPIDGAAVQKKVGAAAASAAVECAKHKTAGAASETYTGSCGFRPGGSTSNTMMGVGGARACVQQRMFSITIGKYAHPQEWHVESFAWSVTVK